MKTVRIPSLRLPLPGALAIYLLFPGDLAQNVAVTHRPCLPLHPPPPWMDHCLHPFALAPVISPEACNWDAVAELSDFLSQRLQVIFPIRHISSYHLITLLSFPSPPFLLWASNEVCYTPHPLRRLPGVQTH